MARMTGSGPGAALAGVLFPSRRRADAFAAVVDGVRPASTPEQHVLAGLALELRTIPVQRTGEMDPEFRSRLRQRLVAVATVQGGGAGLGTSVTEANGQVDAHVSVPETRSPSARDGLADDTGPRDRHPRARHKRLRRVGRRALVGAVALATVTGIVGVGAASAAALPGDVLYGVKRTVESARLALTRSDLDRGHLELALAERRLSEVDSLLRAETGSEGFSGRLTPATTALVGEGLTDMDSSTREGASLLLEVHEQQGIARPVADLELFAREQRTHLEALLPALPPAVRPNAGASLALLDRLLSRAGGMLGETGTRGQGDGKQACSPPCSQDDAAPAGQSDLPSATPLPTAGLPGGGSDPTGPGLDDQVGPQQDQTQGTDGSIDKLIDDLLGGGKDASAPSPEPTSATGTNSLSDLVNKTLPDTDQGTGP